jgi:hypothetical protein
MLGHHYASNLELLENQLQAADCEWVAQVSPLRPGCFGMTGF